MLKFIHRTVMASAFVLPMLAFTAGDVFASKINFRVYNNTSLTLTNLYVSESSLENWGGDILGSGVLRSGGNGQVDFANPSPYACLYDIRAIFEDGQVLEDYRINVCASSSYTFYE